MSEKIETKQQETLPKFYTKKIAEMGAISFSINKYQRAYEWELDDIKKLFNSINNNVYFGSITFENKDGTDWEIIDGQQRLTSLAIIAGGLSRSRKFKFSFNFTDSTITTALNAILNNEIETIKSVSNTIESNPYLQMVKSLKESWLEYFKDTFKRTEKLSFIYKLEKLEIPFINISEYDIHNTFLSMNNSGIQLDFSSYAKADLLLGATPAVQEVIVKNWNMFLNSFYKYNNPRKVPFKKDDAIRQTLQFLKKRYDIKLDRSDASLIPNNIFDEASQYLDYASSILLNKKNKGSGDRIPTDYLFLFSNNIFGSMNPDMFVNSYWISKNNSWSDLEKIKYAACFQLFTLFSFLADDNDMKIKGKEITFKSYYSFNDLKNDTFTKLSKILYESIQVHKIKFQNEIKTNWNKKIQEKFWKNSSTGINNSISSRFSVFYTTIRDVAWSLISTDLSLGEFKLALNRMSKGMVSPDKGTDKISYEHIMGKGESSITFGLSMKASENTSELNSKTAIERYKVYKKNILLPFSKAPQSMIKELPANDNKAKVKECIQKSLMIK